MHNNYNNLKKQYEALEEKTSADFWDKLESKLDRDSEEILHVSTPSFIWWKYVAVILLVVSLGFYSYFELKSDSGNHETELVLKTSNKTSKNEVVQTKKTEVSLEYKQAAFLNNKYENKPKKVVFITKPTIAEQQKPMFDEKTNHVLEIEQENKTIEESSIAINKNPISLEDSKEEQKPIKKQKIYVKADELLFSRELRKEKDEKLKSPLIQFGFSLLKPNRVNLLGTTVYEDEDSKDSLKH